VYGEHRKREIRPRSRFIAVPVTKTPIKTGTFEHFHLEMLAESWVFASGNFSKPAVAPLTRRDRDFFALP
jgi:hypothetical protein